MLFNGPNMPHSSSVLFHCCTNEVAYGLFVIMFMNSRKFPASFLAVVDVALIQRTFVTSFIAQSLMELELNDVGNEVPADTNV